MNILALTFAATLVFLNLGCASPKTMSSKENTSTIPLYETKWLLKKIYTEEGVREVNTKAFIRFDKEKNSAGGNGSCNTFGGTATVAGSELSLKNIFSTKMYCEEVQSIEDVFFRILEKTTRYKIVEKKLQLLQADKVLLEFQAE